jgi:ABC-2 type transport system permease protein
MAEPRKRLWRMRQTAKAFLRASIVEDMSYPMAFVLGQMAVLVPIFITFFIGGLVGENAQVGGDYFTFATIGAAMAAALTSTLQGFGNRLQQIQDRGLFESILVEPISWTWMPIGVNQWNMVRGFINAVLILLLGVPLGATYTWSGFPIAILLMIIGMFAASAIGILSASLMVLAKRSQPVVVLYGLAASIFGGAAFSLDQMPSWLRPVSYLFPHTYVINGTRTVLMADPGTYRLDIPTSLLGLGVTTFVIGGVGLFLFRRSLEIARELGLLSGY